MMRLDELGEFGFIEGLKTKSMIRPEPGIIGIGDDCAVFPSRTATDTLLTTDMLVEGIHFSRATTTPRLLGRKAMAASLSDIAACGGRPREAFISVAVPQEVTVDFLEELFGGLAACAHQYKVNILGGDTTASRRDLVINVAVVGEVQTGGAILRSGARTGQQLYLIGQIGESAAGLDLIRNHRELSDKFPELVAAHLDPVPLVEEGRIIGQSGLFGVGAREGEGGGAMIDISDGLIADLGHICRASGVGARIVWDQIPQTSALGEYLSLVNQNGQELQLGGGEDFALLLAASAEAGKQLDSLMAEAGLCGVRRIGEITNQRGLALILPDGSHREPAPTGWDHFRPRV